MIGVWKPARRKYGVAVASFSSALVLNSLALQFGEPVHILEEYWANETTVTWLRGCTFNKKRKGIFPTSYIVTKDCFVENEGPSEIVIPEEDAIIKEVTFVLREWHRQWKSLFVNRKPLFQTILKLMGELCKFRATLVSNTLTKEHGEEMKHQVVTMIDWGNGILGMDLVPRVNYEQADPSNVSVVEMFRIHERSVKNCQSASVEEEPVGVLKVKDREKQGEAVHHLLVTLFSFACSVGDNSEVLLSLYDNKESRCISEKFVMYFTKDGQREGTDKNNSTIFTDLSSEEIRKDLYLVIHILRRGRLLLENSIKKMANFHYRRPWGISVLCLRELFQNEGEQEFFLKVQLVENESFSNMYENLIKKQIQLSSRTASSDKQNQVMLSLSLLHGDMKNVKIEYPILFSKGVVLTQRIGFPEFINPGEIRNDLYLTLHGAELDRGTKTASKNVEVRVTVYNDQYDLIKDCIFPANGDTMKPNFLSYVLYHNNNPKWNETIRLSIPMEKFSTAHIRLELCHCSNRDKTEKKMIGFSYLSVTTQDKTARMDGKYELCIYKCEDFAKVKNYLKYPSLRDDFLDLKGSAGTNNVHIPYPHSNKEYITVETLLCSSKFAQKAELLCVLQWESQTNLDRFIPQNLESLLQLKGQDLVPYLQDVLDALFNMFSAGGKRPSFVSNIFQTLVCIFNLLHQQMFEKFSIVLEDYLEKSFSSPLAHTEIMHCLEVQAEQVYTCTDFDTKSSKRVFRVLEDIFKFSVKSCMLAQRIYGGAAVKDFRTNLNSIFDAFGKVVSSHEKELQKVQSHMLNNLHKAYTPLLLIISNVDLAHLVEFILKKINLDQGTSIIKAKTNLIKNTINSQLFLDTSSRNMLLPLILEHLKKCLHKQHHLELVVNTTGDLLTSVYKLKETCDIKEEVTRIIQGIFDATIKTLWVLSDNKMKMTGSLLVACLTEMLRLMDVSHYQKLMGDFPKPKAQKVRLSIVVMPQTSSAASKEFLNRVLMVFRNLIKDDDLPPDWATMRMIISSVMLTSIQYIAEDLTAKFLQGSDFDRELWYNFFLMAVDFITQPSLQLEQYSEAKSNQIKSQYNDMRISVGCHIYSLWNQLGQNKQRLILELIGPFLKCTMVPQLELRKSTIPIFFDIMQCEYQLNQHLRRVEDLMIQELDSLVLEHHGDVQYKELFNSILMEKTLEDPELRKEGTRFVMSLTDLLERLLDYREIMDREELRYSKMQCTFKILNYYKDSRRDMYVRYISRLHDLHYTAGNFVEAGLTLQLHAHLLSWSQTNLQAELYYPTQTEAARKEELYSKIIECFDMGKAWEYGIPLCKDLATHYERTFQYRKLGLILQKQAHFFYQILEGIILRQPPTYYRVAYYGNTFPSYIKNQSFILRGDECLKLATIMNQLTTEYPQATILTSNCPIDDSCKQGDAQYIQLVSVKPIPPERPEFAGKTVPSEISFFYSMNEVDTFQFDRPYHRRPKDPNNEFKTLCLERTSMQTTYKLPGILRWYEVSSTQVEHLGPVQTATITVKQMNAELKSSAENAAQNPDNCLQHLAMRLQGVISGAVNGGIPKYQEAFFNKEYSAEYPDEAPYIDILKSVILEQIELLEHGLDVHGNFASSEMMPLHKSLEDMFIKMKSSMGYQTTAQKHHPRSKSVRSESPSSSIPSSLSFTSSGSIRSSTYSNVSDQDDELINTQTNVPPPTLPRVPTTPPAYPPPIPPHIPRKISTTLMPISETPSTKSIIRSDSTKSNDSRSAMTTESSDDGKPGLLPKKRPSINSISLHSFGGSTTSINSISSVNKDISHTKAASPSNSNNDIYDMLSKSQKSPPPKSPLDTPPENFDHSPSCGETSVQQSETVRKLPNSVSSNGETAAQVPTSNKETVSEPALNQEIISQSSTSNNERITQQPKPFYVSQMKTAMQPPNVVSLNEQTTDPHENLNNKTTPKSPNPTAQPSKPDQETAPELPPSLSNLNNTPPPLLPRPPVNKDLPPQPPLFTPSDVPTAMTPPRPPKNNKPPPVPQRKPSTTIFY